jgi:hypothetical protein
MARALGRDGRRDGGRGSRHDGHGRVAPSTRQRPTLACIIPPSTT